MNDIKSHAPEKLTVKKEMIADIMNRILRTKDFDFLIKYAKSYKSVCKDMIGEEVD